MGEKFESRPTWPVTLLENGQDHEDRYPGNKQTGGSKQKTLLQGRRVIAFLAHLKNRPLVRLGGNSEILTERRLETVDVLEILAAV